MISIPLRKRRATFVRHPLLALSLIVAVTALLLPTRFISIIPSAQAVSTTLVISQFQVAGGTAADEFIELHNVSAGDVDLKDLRVVYRAAGSTTDSSTVASWAATTIIPAGGYYLITAAVVGGNGYDGSVPGDVTFSHSGTGAFQGSNGGFAIRNGAVNTGTIIDSVGYGTVTNGFPETTATTAPAANASKARKNNGCTDTDNNANDFETVNPSTPRNAGTTAISCVAATPTLSVNDVTMAEGNTGTTTFTFTVTVSPAPPSNVTFNIATADGTAQDGNPAGEDTDYVAKSETGRTINAGTTTATFTVSVNGDTKAEPNETFFVNVTNVAGGGGVTVGDAQGLGTITNDDIAQRAIFEIQGSSTSSPFAGTQVITTGIVTGRRSFGTSNNGFYIQDPNGDGNLNTSDAVLVFTGSTVPTVTIGDLVQVTGTITEFEPADTDEPDGVNPPDPKTTTELVGPLTISVQSSGNTLPTELDASSLNIFDPTATSRGAQLEKYEHMRIGVASLTVSQPTNNFGEFWGVATGLPRPFREPGIERGDPIPAADEGPFAGTPPPNVPIFDGNFERIMVNSGSALSGSTRRAHVQVTTGTVVTGVVGQLDYAFDNYQIILDANVTPGVSGGLAAAIPVPTPVAGEFTVASANLENFTNNAGRINKASLAIRNVMRTPDVLGVIEVLDQATLTALANKINADVGNPSAVNYQAFLSETSGTQDIGFLVNTARVTPVGTPMAQFVGKMFTYAGQSDTLHDRPPYILTVDVPQTGTPNLLRVVVMLNHTKSLIAVDDPAPRGAGGTEGGRNREKRRLQAEDIADLIEARKNENLIMMGDLNAFDFNDGLGDIVGTMKGTPAPPEQVVEPSTDRWSYQLINSLSRLPANEQYTLLFEGNAQALDHILVNNRMRERQTRFAHARYNADFSASFAADTNRPERLSDHDAPVSYFITGAVTVPGSVLISEFRFNGPNGTSDEFIELYNNSELAVDVTGWTLSSSGGGSVVLANGASIPARGHYLVTSDGFSLEGGVAAFTPPATPDQTYTGGRFPDNGGVRLLDSDGFAIDAAGFSGAAAGFNEGTGLSPAGGVAPTGDEQISFVRRMNSGPPQDSNNNSVDFVLVSTTGTVGGTPNLLGAPGPQSTQSPIQRNATIKASLIDNCFTIGTPTSGCQNRVRDGAATNPTNAARGTLTFRRKFTNTNQQQSVTTLRFRVVDITTLNSPGYAPGNGQADLRLLSSGSATITPSNPFTPGDVEAVGTTLDEPPAQPLGGGLNSSVTVNLPQPLLPNNSVTVQLTVGVQQNGSFRFFVNTEAVLGNINALTNESQTKGPRNGKAAGKQ